MGYHLVSLGAADDSWCWVRDKLPYISNNPNDSFLDSSTLALLVESRHSP